MGETSKPAHDWSLLVSSARQSLQSLPAGDLTLKKRLIILPYFSAYWLR